MKTWIQAALVILVILAGTYIAYEPRLSYPFPLIADEYTHLSLAELIVEEGELPFTNPYLVPETPHFNLESGFHFLTAGLLFIFNGEPLYYYKYFVPVFFLINSLLLFVLVRNWTKDFWAGLFGVFFFGTITSTSAILTHEFFLPLTLGMSLLLSAFLAFEKWTTSFDRRSITVLLLLLLVMTLFYPPALFFFLGVVAVYLLSMDHRLPEALGYSRTRYFATTFALCVFGLAGLLLLLYTFSLLDRIIFDIAWDVTHTRVSPLWYFGYIPSAFAGIGLIATMWKRNKSKVIIYWFLYALAAIFLFYLFNFSVLVPFPRLFLFYLIAVAILAGIGASTVLHAALRAPWWGRFVSIAVIVLFLAAHYYVSLTDRYEYPTVLTPQLHAALSTPALQDAHGVVLTDSRTARTVYPVTRNRVAGLLSSNMGGGDPVMVQRFMSGTCEEKIEALEKLRRYTGETTSTGDIPLFVLTEKWQDCPFFTPLYSSRPYLYAISDTELNDFRRNYYVDKRFLAVEATLPEEPVLTGKALREFLNDTTFYGDGWTEYYAPNGTFWGRTDQPYFAYWQIYDSRYCYFHPATDEGGCRSVHVDGDTVIFFDQNGSPAETARIQHGNPEAL